MSDNTFFQSIRASVNATWAFTIKVSNSDSRIRLIHQVDDNYLLTAHSTDYSNQAIASSLNDEELVQICLKELQNLGMADMVSKFLHRQHKIFRTDLKGSYDQRKNEASDLLVFVPEPGEGAQ